MASRRRKIAVIALLLMAGAAIAIWYASEFNDSDRYTRRWVANACASSTATSSEEVRAMGTNAIPYLIDTLNIRDTWLRRLGAWIGQHRPAPLPKAMAPQLPKVEDLHRRAAIMLADFGSEAKPAVPALILCWQNETCPPAIDTIGSIGPGAAAALPLLRSALYNTNWYFKLHAASALWSVSRETNTLLSVCKAALMQTNDPFAMLGGAEAAEKMDTASRETLAAILIDRLEDANLKWNQRSHAAGVLRYLHIQSEPVRRALLLGAKDPNPAVRRDCAITLWFLWPDDAACASLGVRVFLELAGKPNAMIFLQNALYLGIDPATAVPALKEFLHDDDAEIRLQAAAAIKDIEAFESSPARKQNQSVLRQLQW